MTCNRAITAGICERWNGILGLDCPANAEPAFLQDSALLAIPLAILLAIAIVGPEGRMAALIGGVVIQAGLRAQFQSVVNRNDG